jgi:hypothetical protein
LRPHRLEGSAFPYVLVEPLSAFVVPRSPEGFVLRVLPQGNAASAIETHSLTFAEDLARGPRSAQAIITYGPSEKEPTP